MSVQRPLPAMEIIAVDARPSTTVNERDHARDWLGLVVRAFGKSGLTHKAAAAEMELDPGLLSAQLSGVPGKHLSWLRLGKLPASFWQELLVLVAEYHRLTIGQSVQERTDQELGRGLRELMTKAGVR